MTTLEIEQRVEASAEVTETEVDTLAPKAAETEGVRDLAPSEAASKPQNILDCNQPRSGEPMKQSDALLGRSPTRVEEWLELHTAPREETEAPSMADLHTTNVFVELESPREVTPGEELTMQSPVSAPADCVGSDTESSNASVVQRRAPPHPQARSRSKRELAKMKRNQEMKRKKAAQLEKDSAKTSEKLEEQRKMKLELKNKAAKAKMSMKVVTPKPADMLSFEERARIEAKEEKAQAQWEKWESLNLAQSKDEMRAMYKDAAWCLSATLDAVGVQDAA
eukprot:gene28187-34895_t